MQRWNYRVLFILTFICAACSHKLDQPVAKVEANSSPTPVTSVESPQNQPEVQPSPTAKPVAVQVTKTESGVRLPDIDPLEVEGNLSAVGSSTVFPLSKAIYERFIRSGYAGTIQFDSNSTGAGFKVLCKEGKADIANASRPIKEGEIQTCTSNGRTPVEFRVGTDAVAVVINPKNTVVTNVSKKELANLFTAEKWSDVNPQWPNEKIQRSLPSLEGSRIDLLVDKVLDGKKEQLMSALNTDFSDDNKYLFDAVLSNPYAITLLPYSFYKNQAENLKVISIEGVKPTAETAENGTYILNRPLFIYSETNIIRKKPQVKDFINFYLTYVNQEIEKVGYFPISQQELDKSKHQFLKASESKEPSSN